ncbi:MAG TPA: hypothetical protein VHT52_19395 [Stellaceae bacterium]|jgi:hypothetical protein|nr:hypothetical protein [Stellaceae bacterium]
MAVKETDPLNINQRLYKQLGKLLDDMEKGDENETMTMPQRISALIAIGRVQKMFVDLRKGEFDVGRGSAIDRYATAFAPTDAARRGTNDAGSYFGGSSRDEDDVRDELGDA